MIEHAEPAKKRMSHLRSGTRVGALAGALSFTVLLLAGCGGGDATETVAASSLIISGSESETWLQCSDGAGAFVPKARLRGSQYGMTKIFDAVAKTAALVSLSGPVGPTYYLIDSSDADPCFQITILGAGKDGETANSGLAHAWVATDTGAPGWCVSAKAGNWIPMKAEAGFCPPA